MRERNVRRALAVLVHGDVSVVAERHRVGALAAHRASRRWRRAGGVQGFGIANRITGGRRRAEVVLTVYVKRKRPRREVRNPVPRSIRVPGIPGLVKIDVVPIGTPMLQESLAPVRPTFPGAEVAHPSGSFGTFGCLVRLPGQSDLFILSNAHVLAPTPVAREGDLITTPRGGNPIGTLSAAAPFQFSAAGFPNRVDAAVARVLDPTLVGGVVGSVQPVKGVSTTITRGMPVQKVGSASGLTCSRVIGIDVHIALRYRGPNGRVSRVGFQNQVLCVPYTTNGDSGSLVLNAAGEAVGLHFAGTPEGSLFNRIDAVLDAFGVEIVVG